LPIIYRYFQFDKSGHCPYTEKSDEVNPRVSKRAFMFRFFGFT
jgi:hypothetical protein